MYSGRYSRNDVTQGVVPRDDTPLEDVTTPDEKKTHDFLLKGPDAAYYPVNVMRDLRAGIETLPKTKGVFKLSRVLDDHPLSVPTKKLLLMCGSWEPNEATTTANSQRVRLFVNPRSKSKRRFSDAVVRCKCGGIICWYKDAGERTIEFPSDAVGSHEDDCLKQWRRRTQARLFERRAEILNEMIPLGHHAGDCYARLGVPEDYTTATHLAEDIGVNIGELKEEYAERRANTAVELLTLFKPEEVGAAYGRSASTIRTAAKQKVGSLKPFREVRRENREKLDVEYEP
jgi:hypothetical protein